LPLQLFNPSPQPLVFFGHRLNLGITPIRCVLDDLVLREVDSTQQRGFHMSPMQLSPVIPVHDLIDARILFAKPTGAERCPASVNKLPSISANVILDPLGIERPGE
jgi:hypothetical protein